jgi:predicted NBD/HSP70 family sugar kinase
MGEKADSELVRRQNRRIVLAALRQHGASARVELGRLTGLSPASITTISAQLISEGIISEEGTTFGAPSSGKRGRPVVRLALNPDAALVMAVKISIDDVMIALTDFRGEIIARNEIRLPTYGAGRQEFGGQLATEIVNFLAWQKVPAQRIARIGVAVQGLADSRRGTIVWSPAFAAGDIPVAQSIETRLGIPCIVANDANMIAEGLVTIDKQRYGGVTAAIFTGYGVGMGIIINGDVFHGATGAAAEFGHMNHIPDGALCRCGRRGCLEAYVADYGIVRHFSNETDIAVPRSAVPESIMTGLHQRAKSGDTSARRAFETAGKALGYGIGRVISILNPDRIVLAGPGLQTSDLLEHAMREALEDSVVEVLRRDVVIEQVRFSDDMILRGTIDSLLRTIDREVFAAAASGSEQEETHP